MIHRGSVIAAVSFGVVAGLSYAQWRITSPGWITDTEWHVLLIVCGPALVFTLCSVWVGDGRPPVDTRRGDHRVRSRRP